MLIIGLVGQGVTPSAGTTISSAVVGGMPRGSEKTENEHRRQPGSRHESCHRAPRTMARQMARPRPTPGVALSRGATFELLEMASSRPFGKPGPLSSTHNVDLAAANRPRRC
jgi:hypothetical protein